MKNIKSYIKQNKKSFLETWFETLRIPSVSAMPEHKADMKKMAAWFARYFTERLGFTANVIPTAGHPLVYAESPQVPGAPTVLIYGHYDVQPADPLDEWITPPFEPTVRNENVYARGANDDKGQLLTHLFGVEAIQKTRGELPMQVKFMLEGEEEIGSASLEKFLAVAANRKKLAADVILVSDTAMPASGQPGITYGLRGLLGCEITLTGPNRDLHSGHYGGSMMNPAIALGQLLGGLIDAEGKILIPGFYDGVLAITETERRAFAANPFDERASLKMLDVAASFGEPAYSVLERRSGRPSFDINGLTSGYQGKGGKTIIPSKASAKFTFRLVPNQDPKQIFRSLRSYLKKRLHPGLKMKLLGTQATPGMVVSLESPFVMAAVKGLTQAFRKKPLFVREGGSIPVVAALGQGLGADIVLAGFGLEDDGIHSPNEKFSLQSFYQGIEASAAMISEFSALPKEKRS